MKYQKLVRDKIPDIIKEHNKKPIIRILSPKDYQRELLKKLVEEVNEVSKAEDSEALLEELADVLEVIHATIISVGTTLETVEEIRINKKNKRGGFDKRIFLEEVLE